MIISSGWKDILRPIRDGYRHLFPSPDTGPSPEERAKQRELDRLKGFAYFDTFDQLEAWSETDVDPIQRANTPLLPRFRPTTTEAEQKKAAVLLCHDYSGNYHDYEAVQRTGVEKERYVCEYLQYVEKNGVQALGTILIESQTRDPHRLLAQIQSGNMPETDYAFPLAKKLADIAQHYGFDGYLVNIEKPFTNQEWDPLTLTSFLRQLKKNLGQNRSLTWYDALTVDNKVAYQNALTTKNVIFSEACGEILTNYSWRESDAVNSKFFASAYGKLSADRVFFGIDAWAQNVAPLTRRRITYPSDKGGGTYCGIAVEKLSEIGLSAGIFAPAWTFEHFQSNGKMMEQATWEGISPSEVSCSCGDACAQHPPNEKSYITRYAKDFPAGSDRFFYTDFSRGFGRHTQQETDRLYSGRSIHSQLASQSILPRYSKRNTKGDGLAMTGVLYHKLEDVAGQTKLVIELSSIISQEGDEAQSRGEDWLPLFWLDMPPDPAMFLSIAYKMLLQGPTASLSFFLRFSNGMRYVSCDGGNAIQCPIQCADKTETHGRLQEIGVRLRAPYTSGKSLRVMEIQSIKIASFQPTVSDEGAAIYNIKIIKSRNSEEVYWRLRWAYLHGTRGIFSTSGVPYSAITGPFSHFLIRVDGLDIGWVYALEHILPTPLMRDQISDKVSIEVTGVGFDGTEIANKSTTIRKEEFVEDCGQMDAMVS